MKHLAVGLVKKKYFHGALSSAELMPCRRANEQWECLTTDKGRKVQDRACMPNRLCRLMSIYDATANTLRLRTWLPVGYFRQGCYVFPSVCLSVGRELNTTGLHCIVPI